MAAQLDIAGMRFGRLVAVKRNGYDIQPSRNHIKWDCVCDCGAIVNVRLNNLRGGNIKSCGCLKKESSPNKTHGMRKSPEYETWAHIKSRCLNPNSLDYPLYGGRGILICQEWVDSFEAFYADMGTRPGGKSSIDRIDVNGNYEKINCRWANNYTQSRNKRSNVMLEFNGKVMCQSDWANHLGINVSTLIQRLKNWSLEKALSTFKGN